MARAVTRRFIRCDVDGTVVQDLIATRDSWEGVTIPPGLVEVTDHPQWGEGAGPETGESGMVTKKRETDGRIVEKDKGR